MRLDVARTGSGPIAWKVLCGDRVLRFAGSKRDAVRFAVEFVTEHFRSTRLAGDVFVEAHERGFLRYLSVGNRGLGDITSPLDTARLAATIDKARRRCAKLHEAAVGAKQRIDVTRAQVAASRKALAGARTALDRLERSSERERRALIVVTVPDESP